MAASYDAIVVGAGTAGIPCAIAAAEHGCSVAVIEKTAEIGGTLHITGGELSAAGSRRQRQAGIEDTPAAHLAEVMAKSGGFADRVLVGVAVNEARHTIDWLEELGFPFIETPAIFEVHEQWSQSRTFLGEDWGLSVLATLRPSWDHLVERGAIDVFFEHELTDLAQADDGRVSGIQARASHGTVELRAPSVVLATGGYGANAELLGELTPDRPRIVSGARESSTGDGIVAARRAGAQLRGAEHHYPVPGPIELELGRADPWVAVANLVPAERSPREIYVNAAGERFMAEDEPSPDVREHAVRSQPSQRFWIVFDDDAIAGHPLVYRMQRHDSELQSKLEAEWEGDGLRARARGGNVVWCAPSVRELAEQAGIDPDGLERAVETWNQQVRIGHDPLGRVELGRPGSRSPRSTLSRVASRPSSRGAGSPSMRSSACSTAGGVRSPDSTRSARRSARRP